MIQTAGEQASAMAIFAPPAATVRTGTDARAGKYLSFRLANEDFAIQVQRVREIMGVQEVTAAPQTPVYVKGVMNLRGKVIPVIDLRLKLGLPEAGHTPQTCIIVVQVEHPSGKLQMGVIVDSVNEVLTLQSADIEDVPDFGGGTVVPYLLGMARSKRKVNILLDIGRALTGGEGRGFESGPA